MTRNARHWLLVPFLIASFSLALPRSVDAQKALPRRRPPRNPSAPKPNAGSTSPSSAEARTARAFDEARKQGPEALRAFLYRMPKGADLHNHLSGAIYAESWIRAAGEDHLCVDTKTLAFAKPTA